MTASAWRISRPADGVLAVRRGDGDVPLDAALERLLESQAHRVVLALDLNAWPDVARALLAQRMPVVAAVGGLVGQNALATALAADIRVAGDDLAVRFANEDGGVLTDATLLALLARVVGSGIAGYWVLTRRTVRAAEALQRGLADRVVPADTVESEAVAEAGSIAEAAPLALAYAKEAIARGARVSFADAVELENDLYSILHTTDDRAEGVRAFLEKRAPVFKGR